MLFHTHADLPRLQSSKSPLTKLIHKNKPWHLGLLAVLSPLPMLIVTSMWSVLWGIWFGIGVLNYTTIPDWILAISLLPLLVSPTLGILGIAQGIIRRKERRAWIGILLSVLGLMGNVLLIYGIGYLGSRF